MTSNHPVGPAADARGTASQSALSSLSKQLERLVSDTMESLSERGIDAYELAPLMKLRDAVRALDDSGARRQEHRAEPAVATAAAQDCFTYYDRDGRRSQVKASEELMARASAIIDVLVQGGQTPEHAAQIITRQLLAFGIELPESGGDARAWKRLHNWRNTLIHYKRAGPAWDIYCGFREELSNIPPDQRLRRAVGERLWDRRREHMAAQESA